jgi:hypothetical protein
MYLKLIIAAFLWFGLGWRKDNEELMIQPKSAAQLLTQKTWKMVSHGIDHNKNNAIDGDEDLVMECEKDNRYTFKMDGSALFQDNINICGDGITELPFTWKLINNNTALDFDHGISQIQKLNENELVIYHESMFNGEVLRFYLILKN